MCSYSLRQFRSESFTFSAPPPAPKLSRQRSSHCYHPSLNHHHLLPGLLQQPPHWSSAFHPGLLTVCSYQRTKGTLLKYKPDRVTLLLKISNDFSSQTKSQSSFNGQHDPPRSDPCSVTLSPPTFPQLTHASDKGLLTLNKWGMLLPLGLCTGCFLHLDCPAPHICMMHFLIPSCLSLINITFL